MFRKVAPWYAKRFGPSSEFNKRVVLLASRAHYQEILQHYIQWRAQFVDAEGELLPRYVPPPMVASFMQAPVESEEPAVAKRQHIPVPKGPVEVW